MMERHLELESSIKTQANNLERVTASISGLQQSISEQTAKLTAINFDVKALTRISTEAVEKLEIQEKNIEDLTKEMSQIKVNLEILEEKPETMNVMIGRLLWKITNVEARMSKAKENGMVLQSPIFFTHEFGYKIRGLLYLNGLNKWRDRYSLLCLQVMKGEYDMTLKWPCNIEGSVTLRDVQNHDEPKNFSKFISAKHQKPDEENEDPQESSSTYIFIPHRILQKPSYLKEDTIFIDLQINRCRESAKETNL
ncbi:hypothetical protein WA026_019203 [Henosepilachna vigintioctopunctata]|uniref:MATH domain-containing protein n=1 Tax=Henosepilachna vigintioctopunctata TaxID=420089 RepID=A0AAW1UTV7_9CUCU